MKAVARVGNLVKSHNFFVVKDLITPVILGTDFLQEHRLLLDFTTPVTVVQEARSRLNNLWKAEQVFKIKKCSVAAIEVEDAEDKLHTMVEDCAIPLFGKVSEEEHKQHLSAIFSRLKTAGLTLRGRKCQIGMPQVTYLGHVFCAASVTPDETKVKAVMEWPTPSSTTEVRQFLGLASYYRKFICHFSDIAAPLHKLTQKDNPFCWTADCEAAFRTLKSKLTSAPVSTYPRFDKRASHFVLQTDASAVGLGAILQQDGYVIGYVSRVLSKSEANYSVIQRECLTLMYGMKQFRHY